MVEIVVLLYLQCQKEAVKRNYGSTKQSQKAQRVCHFLNHPLFNVLNPKTMLFFLSIFSQLVPVDDSSSHQFAFFYGVYMSAMHMIWFCLVAWLVTSKKVLGVFHRAGHRVNQVCGVGLIAFGASLVLAK
ncbi:LysE family translocator [Thalassotalea marina]|uniref:LysE family translocator n=1 Tax=Thalassotalea marina TaxID=1673741 RepID=UPI001671CBB4|nr:LysE family transporter [Thalassotalea marina]